MVALGEWVWQMPPDRDDALRSVNSAYVAPTVDHKLSLVEFEVCLQYGLFEFFQHT